MSPNPFRKACMIRCKVMPAGSAGALSHNKTLYEDVFSKRLLLESGCIYSSLTGRFSVPANGSTCRDTCLTSNLVARASGGSRPYANMIRDVADRRLQTWYTARCCTATLENLTRLQQHEPNLSTIRYRCCVHLALYATLLFYPEGN